MATENELLIEITKHEIAIAALRKKLGVKRWLTFQETTAKLRCSESTLKRWAKRFPHIGRNVTGRWEFDADVILAHVNGSKRFDQ